MIKSSSNLTLKEWQAKYENYIRLHYHGQHQTKWYKLLEKWVRFLGPDRLPRHVFVQDVKIYMLDHMKTMKNETNLRQVRFCGQQFFEFIAENEGVDPAANPFRECKFLHPEIP